MTITIKGGESVIHIDGEVARELLTLEQKRNVLLQDPALKVHTQAVKVLQQATKVKSKQVIQTSEEVVKLLAVAIQGPVGGVGPPGPQGPPGPPAEEPPKSPQFTYENGLLTRVDYEGDVFKLLSYDDGVLQQLDFTRDGVTKRKEFVYDAGVLIAINESVLP